MGNLLYPSFAHFYSQLGVITEYSWTHVALYHVDIETIFTFLKWLKKKAVITERIFLYPPSPNLYTEKLEKVRENITVLASEFNFTDTYAERKPMENLCIYFRGFLRCFEHSHKTRIYWGEIL